MISGAGVGVACVELAVKKVTMINSKVQVFEEGCRFFQGYDCFGGQMSLCKNR